MLAAKLTSLQITEWMAYERIEPFGAQHAELMAAIIAREVANNGTRTREVAAEVENFMPSYRPPDDAPTPDDLFLATIRQAKDVANAGRQT